MTRPVLPVLVIIYSKTSTEMLLKNDFVYSKTFVKTKFLVKILYKILKKLSFLSIKYIPNIPVCDIKCKYIFFKYVIDVSKYPDNS